MSIRKATSSVSHSQQRNQTKKVDYHGIKAMERLAGRHEYWNIVTKSMQGY